VQTHLLELLGGLAGEDISADREVAEQIQVRSVHQRAGNEVRGVIVTRLAGDLVVPAGHAYTSTHEHLGDLRDGDEHGREGLGTHAQRLQAVVAVHKSVHGVVHGHEVESRACHGGVGTPAEQQHSHVVVPVQEDERSLAEHDEHRVDELRHLTVDEEHHPEAGRTGAPGLSGVGADGLVIRLGHQRTNQEGHLKYAAEKQMRTRFHSNGHILRSSYRLQHADEGEDAQQSVPASQRQAKVKRLGLLRHNVRAGGDESNVRKHNADDKGPVVGGEVDSDSGHEVTFDGKGQESGGRHEVVGEVGHEG